MSPAAPAETRPLRILKLSCMFIPEVYGGAEQQCLRQAQALVRRGHRVTIVTARTSRATPAGEVMGGVEVHRLYSLGQPDLLGRWLPFTVVWLVQLVFFALRNRDRFDVVHCHQGKFGAFAGAAISRILRLPQIVKIGNSAPFMDLSDLRKKKIVGPLFVRLALANRPLFVAISSKIASELAEFGIDRLQIKMIVNGIVSPPAGFVAPHPGEVHLFWHGRFEPIKNLPLMLNAFALARARMPGLKLHLIGSGSEESRLKELAASLRLGDSVEFLAARKNVLEWISRYDVFVNTSVAEGMSNSMLEAMALGKAIVSTPVSGTAEIIDQGVNGFTVSGFDSEAVGVAFCEAATLYARNAMDIYAYNRRKALQVFSADAIAVEYEELYRSLARVGVA